MRGGRREPGLGGMEAAREAKESPSRGAPARRRKGRSATDSDEISGNLYVEAGKGDSGTDNFGRDEPAPRDLSRTIDDGARTEEGVLDLTEEGATDRTDLSEDGVTDLAERADLKEEGLVLLRLDLGLSTTTSKTYFCFLFSLTYASNKSSSKRKIASLAFNIFFFNIFYLKKIKISKIKMETSSKDVLFTIAMNLDLSDLLRWCASSSHVNKNVCLQDDVWRSKLLQDYPDYHNFKLNRSPRETYVFLYQLSYIKKLLNTNDSLMDIFQRKRMDLSGKKLRKVPAFDLPNLQELFLDNNQLTKVPAFNLPNLRVLHMFKNQLTKVPAFNFPYLQILYLYNNQLTEVPAFNFPDLKYLDLSNNRLTEVPAFYLPNLQHLDLSNNQLPETTKNELRKYKVVKV